MQGRKFIGLIFGIYYSFPHLRNKTKRSVEPLLDAISWKLYSSWGTFPLHIILYAD